MLRRASKRSKIDKEKQVSHTKKHFSDSLPLGSKKRKVDEEEKALESLVIGSGEDLIQNLEKFDQKVKTVSVLFNNQMSQPPGVIFSIEGLPDWQYGQSPEVRRYF